MWFLSRGAEIVYCIIYPNSLIGLCLACPQALHFQRSVEDVEKWLEDVENELKAPYSSNDLVVLNSHLKKQEELEEDIAGHRDRLQELVNTAQEFQQQKHFLADELEDRVDQLVQRCGSDWPVSCYCLPIFLSFLLPCIFFSFSISFWKEPFAFVLYYSAVLIRFSLKSADTKVYVILCRRDVGIWRQADFNTSSYEMLMRS